MDPGSGSPDVAATSVEEILTNAWRRVLGPKGQETGGNILHASVGLRRLVRFQKEVESALGVQIPPTVLLRLGTIDAIADAIRRDAWPAPSPLVLLRDGRPDMAIYIPSSASGFILELCELAVHIEFPGQIWGLQLPGLDGEAEPLNSIGAMARHYADAILQCSPTRACHLIGYSGAGVVIVEMTRILEAAGRVVDPLLLLDSTTHEAYWPWPAWVRFALGRAGRRLRELRGLPPGDALRHVALRLRGIRRHLGRRLEVAAGPVTHSKYYIGGLEPDFQRVRDAAIAGYEAHRPRPIDHRAILFKAALGDPHNCDPAGIWKRLIPDLDVVMVPGSHVTMIRKPTVKLLAEAISRRIR
jgi:thioesterase domain-containing protein